MFYERRQVFRSRCEERCVFYVTPHLTQRSLHVARTVYLMCSVSLSEQRAIISLYVIKHMLFIVEKDGVYCEVGFQFCVFFTLGLRSASECE